MKHTETPWEKDYGGTTGHIKSVANLDNTDKKYPSSPTVCRYDVITPSISEEEQQANAAFIVKACNEYHPMLRIMKALVNKLDAETWFLETAYGEGICTESIKQIIKQAEAE